MPSRRTLDDELLLSVAHPVMSPARVERAARLAARSPRWASVVAGAERHGLAALLHGHLAALPDNAVPPAVRDGLAAGARRCVAWNLLLRHELQGLLAAFAAASLDVMPLKGPVLADELYPDPVLRATADLDLLARPGHAGAAAEVLGPLGYARLPEPEQGAGYHTRFGRARDEGAGVVVELHDELGEGHVSRPRARDIWASASAGAWGGRPIWRMRPADLVVYLCFHAAKDGLASLRALLDVTLLLEREREALAWGEVTARARAAHVATPVYLALRESRALLGAPVPAAVLRALRPRRVGWHLSRAVFRWRGGVLHAPDALLVGPVMAVLMMLWEDAPRGTLRHLRRNLVPSPSLRDRWSDGRRARTTMGRYAGWLWHAARQGTRQLVASRTREG